MNSKSENYQGQDVSGHGSTLSVDLQALDNNIVIYFIQGCVKKDFFNALLKIITKKGISKDKSPNHFLVVD